MVQLAARKGKNFMCFLATLNKPKIRVMTIMLNSGFNDFRHLA